MKRLIDAYGATYERILPEIDALTEYIEAQQAAGKLTSAAIKKSAVYQNLINSIERELTDYSGYLKVETTKAATDAAKSGLAGGRLLILIGLAEALGVDVKAVPKNAVSMAPPDALAFLRDYLDPRGPLFAKIQYLSGYHSVAIADGILEMVGNGKNPRDIAKWITDAYGMGLTDSMRMCRTAQLYSYRQANNAVQVANSDVLQGVVWCAELDDRVCMSCVELHGQVFPVGTVCDDHHNGRCAMLPWVNGVENPVSQTGEDWFTAQDEATQKRMMGVGKWNAWQDGKFELSQLSTIYSDPVFGDMRSEATLKTLLGE